MSQIFAASSSGWQTAPWISSSGKTWRWNWACCRQGFIFLETPPSPRGGWAEGRENWENVKEIGRKGNRKEKWLVKVENNVNRRNINNKKVSEE
jgi:hypothetical protein